MNVLREMDQFITGIMCAVLLILFIALLVVSLFMLPQWFNEQYDGFMTRCLKQKTMPECNQEWRERDD